MTGRGEAYAKINISLDIVSKRDDGYHEMLTVMQSVGLCDDVTIECSPGEGITVETGLAYLPGDERNIAAKAALAFFAHTGIGGYNTRIAIKKRIPVCAGLGGGSADGACVLRVLNEMFSTSLTSETLKIIGGTIGSDIPFCVTGGTALARGRGDELTQLAPLPPCYIVITKPPFSFSTPELFSKIRCEKIKARPDTDGIIDALARGDLSAIAKRMYNVFEDALPRGARDISDIKYALLDCGALGAVMTGAGSAVFGLFDNEDYARTAFEKLSENFSECFLTETISRIM